MSELQATLVMLNPLKGDDVVGALHVLGPAIEELDRAAHDAGFRLRLIVTPAKSGIRSKPLSAVIA